MFAALLLDIFSLLTILLQIVYPETWYFSKLQCVESCRTSYSYPSADYVVVNWADKSCTCMGSLDASIPIVNPLLCSGKPYEVMCVYSLDVTVD